MSPHASTPAIQLVTDDHGTVSIDERISAMFALVETAPRQARRILNGALAEWGLGHLADSADLITSELVTNAVVHGRPPAKAEFYVDRKADGGLLIVEMLADDWGIEPCGQGKRVWASLSIGER